MAEINYLNGYEIADAQARSTANNASSVANEANGKATRNETNIVNLSAEVEALGSGSPLPAASTAEMTETDRLYVNTTDGYIYYYDGDTWTQGWEYQAAEDSHTVDSLNYDMDNVRDTETGINLINQRNSVIGYLQSDGTVPTNGAYANYSTSEFIPVESGAYYLRCFHKTTNLPSSYTRGFMLYNENKEILDNTYYTSPTDTNGNEITVPLTAKYIRVFYNNITNPMLIKGNMAPDYIPFEEKYINKMYLNLNGEVKTVSKAFNDKISKINKTINLINPNEIESGKFITNNGTIVDLASYNTSGFIPVKENQKITITPYCRAYMFYKDEDYPLIGSYNNESINTPRTVTSPIDGYIRISFASGLNSLIMAYYGEDSISYVPYNANNYFEENIHASDTLLNDIKEIYGDTSNKLKVNVSGNNISVESYPDGDNKLVRNYFKQSSDRNKTFNFSNSFLNDTLIKQSSDDITPQRIALGNQYEAVWTIGANHGWPGFKITKGDLTVEDTGSIWSDGNNQYVLIYVDNNYGYFAYPCSKVNNRLSINRTNPIDSLTHVSGATHTNSLSISNLSTEQLYPSINHNSVYLNINGNNVDDGIYYSDELKIVEHYEIIDYYEMVEYLKTNTGSDLNEIKDNIQALAAIDNIYTIDEINEKIFTTLTAIEELRISNSGFLQAGVLSANTGTVYRYLNGVSSGQFASNSLVDLTNYNTSNYILKNQLSNSNIPVNRCVDLCKDSNDNILYGFCFGFIPDKGDGSNELRKNLKYQWDLRDSKKSYPYCVYGKSLSVGDEINVAGYRHYIMPGQDITNKTAINFNEKDYLFIDSHSAFNTNISSNKLGASVNSIENNDIVFSNIVGVNGVRIKSSEGYSSAILKTD